MTLRLLNLGCGGIRLKPPFINVDNLRIQLKVGSAERNQLDQETNYIDHDLRDPFPADFPHEVDGILLSHVAEHLDLQSSIILFWRCRELLKVGGILRVSVPDPKWFYNNRISGDGPEFVRSHFDPGYGAAIGWTEFALFYTQHVQCLDAHTLTLQLSAAGFDLQSIHRTEFQKSAIPGAEASGHLSGADNRDHFSVFIEAVRSEVEPTEAQRNHHNHMVAERYRCSPERDFERGLALAEGEAKKWADLALASAQETLRFRNLLSRARPFIESTSGYTQDQLAVLDELDELLGEKKP